MSIQQTKNYNKLIKRIKASNIGAFEEIFKEFQENIYSYLFFKLGDTQSAEDILQDVFVKLWENRHSLKPDLYLPSYLYTIAKNLTLNYFRHKNVVQKFQQEIELKTNQKESSSPLSQLELNELKSNLALAIQNLPDQQRTVFMMSRYDELSYKEIAERLGLSVKTVETHIGKALKTLRKMLRIAL
jgi:RNA polymerase sigma-70 factor, ECF subfamily